MSAPRSHHRRRVAARAGRTQPLAGPSAAPSERVAWALEHTAGDARAVVELRRAGGGVAAPGHAAAAGHPGDPDRHRLPVPGDLSLRRRAHRAPAASTSRSTARRSASPGWKRASASSGNRASTASSATTACARSNRCSARWTNWACAPGSPACAAARRARRADIDFLRTARRPLEAAPDRRLERSRRVATTCSSTTCPITRCGTRATSRSATCTPRARCEAGMNEEDTRFFGLKRECGLHFDVSQCGLIRQDGLAPAATVQSSSGESRDPAPLPSPVIQRAGSILTLPSGDSPTATEMDPAFAGMT